MTRTLVLSNKGIWKAGLLSLLTTVAWAGEISFSGPLPLATLSWTDASGPGAPSSGADWLIADPKVGILLVSGLDFDLFSWKGQWKKTIQPLDTKGNFYGFCGATVLSKGTLAFLERMESAQEQWGKDNFEMRSKPGIQWVTLDPQGALISKTEWTDPLQPHSSYWLLEGGLYAVHDDGTFTAQEPKHLSSAALKALNLFAQVASAPDHWAAHLRTLPIFHAKDRAYHDIQGKAHEIKEADSFLLGRRYVEGVGPLGLRRGRIYYQVTCDSKDGFRNAVFVEDPAQKRFALIELVPSAEGLEGARKPALFLDPQGNLFEGVAAKEGYRVYEWKIKN
jgi:hypothetical protein